MEELASEGESPGPETRLSASLGGLSEKNPYRDSAYFSDLDTEPDPPLGPKEKQGGVPVPGPEPDLESLKSPRLPSALPSPELGMLGEAQGSGPREVPPLPLLEDSSPEPSACPRGPRLEPPWPQDPAQVPPMPSPGHAKIFLLTPVRPSSEGHRPELQETLGLLSGSGLQERTGGPGAPRTPLCLALPAVPAAPEGRPEEEEDDSEDSDESDEELRCYSIQEPSEESEEEAPPVPVVVAESQSARNLRSLLIRCPACCRRPSARTWSARRKPCPSSTTSPSTSSTRWAAALGGLCVAEWGSAAGREAMGDSCCSDPPGKPHPGARGALPWRQGVVPHVPGGQPGLPQHPRPASAG